MADINSNKLIIDYISGNLSPKEIKSLDAQYDRAQEWKKFRKRIPAWKRHTPHILYAVSAVAMLLAVAFFSYHRGTADIHNRFAEFTVSVPDGAQMSLDLPDGSTVTLNGGTRLCYSQGFGITDRNVTIDGEGYFEVTRNELLPMMVKSSNMSVEVLGTKFSYKDYSGEKNTSIALTQGSVKVTAAEDCLVLKPGQSASLNHRSGLFKVSDNRNDVLTAWLNGEIFFDEESLNVITDDLTHKFGYCFEFKTDELKDLRFYAVFANSNTSIEKIMSQLSATGAFNYEITNKHVTLW